MSMPLLLILQKMASGQLQELGKSYCNQTWYISTLLGNVGLNCFWTPGIKVKVTVTLKRIIDSGRKNQLGMYIANKLGIKQTTIKTPVGIVFGPPGSRSVVSQN
jgi:hypothetical protein